MASTVRSLRSNTARVRTDIEFKIDSRTRAMQPLILCLVALLLSTLAKDHFKTLGVSRTASDRDITRAYRDLAKKYHPDKNPGQEQRFIEVAEAYEILSDDTKKRQHLQELSGGRGGGGRRMPKWNTQGQQGQRQHHFHRQRQYADEFDMDEIEEMFMRAFGQGGGGRMPRGSGGQQQTFTYYRNGRRYTRQSNNFQQQYREVSWWSVLVDELWNVGTSITLGIAGISLFYYCFLAPDDTYEEYEEELDEEDEEDEEDEDDKDEDWRTTRSQMYSSAPVYKHVPITKKFIVATSDAGYSMDVLNTLVSTYRDIDFVLLSEEKRKAFVLCHADGEKGKLTLSAVAMSARGARKRYCFYRNTESKCTSDGEDHEALNRWISKVLNGEVTWSNDEKVISLLFD